LKELNNDPETDLLRDFLELPAVDDGDDGMSSDVVVRWSMMCVFVILLRLLMMIWCRAAYPVRSSLHT